VRSIQRAQLDLFLEGAQAEFGSKLTWRAASASPKPLFASAGIIVFLCLFLGR
jgi:hypothetical protein